MRFHIDLNGLTKSINIKKDDSIWTSAFSKHGFTGSGSLVKISDGQNINYLEKIDLINTYKIKNFLNRAKNDLLNWGYDN